LKFGRKHLWKVGPDWKTPTWPPWEALVSDWLEFLEFSSLNRLMHGSFSTNLSHFVPIGNKD